MGVCNPCAAHARCCPRLLSHLQVLGTDSFYAYLNKYGLELDPQLEALVGRHRWAGATAGGGRA